MLILEDIMQHRYGYQSIWKFLSYLIAFLSHAVIVRKRNRKEKFYNTFYLEMLLEEECTYLFFCHWHILKSAGGERERGRNAAVCFTEPIIPVLIIFFWLNGGWMIGHEFFGQTSLSLTLSLILSHSPCLSLSFLKRPYKISCWEWAQVFVMMCFFLKRGDGAGQITFLNSFVYSTALHIIVLPII